MVIRAIDLTRAIPNLCWHFVIAFVLRPVFRADIVSPKYIQSKNNVYIPFMPWPTQRLKTIQHVVRFLALSILSVRDCIALQASLLHTLLLDYAITRYFAA